MASTASSLAQLRALARGLVNSLPDGAAALQAENDLRQLAATFQGDLYRQLVNPAIELPRRVELARAVAEKLNARPEVAALIAVIVEIEALKSLKLLPAAVARQREARFGLVVVTVRTAKPLSEEQKQKLADAFAKKTGKVIVVEEKLDPTLIAGAVATVGSEIFDSSVTGLMRALTQTVAAA